jgi:dienelactone hydrolase
MKWPLLSMVAALLPVAAAVESAPLFRFAEKPGVHGVGLKVVEQYDSTRDYRDDGDERARPLQTLIWYPAMPGRGRPMQVKDYVHLWATETNFGKPEMPARAREWLEAVQPVSGESLWAVRDAPEAAGRFPLVIYAPSFSSTAWENADLCEYLASHGYVVIATPSLGARSRDMTLDLSGAEVQARDIVFLIGYARTLPQADLSAVAVAGFSWGGLANLLAAARDDRVDALVALDGTLRYYPGVVRQATRVHPERMSVPLLYFAQGTLTLEDYFRHSTAAQRNGPNVLDAWRQGDLITAHMLALTHREMSSMYQRNESFWKDFHQKWYPAGYEREDGIDGYKWIARYTLRFLNAYLKSDASSAAFLKRRPVENGVPAHVMAVTYRAGMRE